jgi:membrane protease YdiL (CAAX protease family)
VSKPLETRRIIIFIALAFGIAWLCALAVYLTGGIVDSPELIPDSGITLSAVLLAGGYMWAPAWAHVLTRLVTREGWKDAYMRRRQGGWPYWIAAWFIPSAMTILGGALFFAVFPQYFDASLGPLREALVQAGRAIPDALWPLVMVQTLSAVAAAPLMNGLFAFGEEFGWRAYLQPKLMPLGARRTILLAGLIWGVWHWPLIAMGYNYGPEYPGAPWLGMLMMVWVTIGLGTFLGWLTIRAGNVWPAVIGHAAINGIGSLAAVCLKGNPNLLLGPYPLGIVGSAAWALLTLALLLWPGALAERPAESLPLSEESMAVSRPAVPSAIDRRQKDARS